MIGARMTATGSPGNIGVPSGSGEEVAREAEVAEVVEEGRGDVGELRQAAQVVDLLVA